MKTIKVERGNHRTLIKLYELFIFSEMSSSVIVASISAMALLDQNFSVTFISYCFLFFSGFGDNTNCDFLVVIQSVTTIVTIT